MTSKYHHLKGERSNEQLVVHVKREGVRKTPSRRQCKENGSTAGCFPDSPRLHRMLWEGLGNGKERQACALWLSE